MSEGYCIHGKGLNGVWCCYCQPKRINVEMSRDNCVHGCDLTKWACDACELDAANARVKELEATLVRERAAFDIATDTHNEDMRLLDAANADRARLRGVLSEYVDSFMEHGVRGHPHPLLQREGADALTSTDASAWLRERERRVAERVRGACGEYLHVRTSGEFDYGSMLADLDLDALLKVKT